jgi:hypothetical protein
MAVSQHGRFLSCMGVAALLAVNVLMAVGHSGTRSGQTYRWVCRESGAQLSYTPSVFGSVRLVPGRARDGFAHRWKLVEPRAPSAWLPWNWLAVLLVAPPPDPEVILRQQSKIEGGTTP